MAYEQRSAVIALALNAHFESFALLEKGFACHSDASCAPVCGRWHGKCLALQVRGVGIRILFHD